MLKKHDAPVMAEALRLIEKAPHNLEILLSVKYISIILRVVPAETLAPIADILLSSINVYEVFYRRSCSTCSKFELLYS